MNIQSPLVTPEPTHLPESFENLMQLVLLIINILALRLDLTRLDRISTATVQGHIIKETSDRLSEVGVVDFALTPGIKTSVFVPNFDLSFGHDLVSNMRNSDRQVNGIINHVIIVIIRTDLLMIIQRII